MKKHVRRYYSNETKRELVTEFLASGLSYAQFGKAKKINPLNIARWAKQIPVSKPQTKKSNIDTQIENLSTKLSALKHLKTEAKRLGVEL